MKSKFSILEQLSTVLKAFSIIVAVIAVGLIIYSFTLIDYSYGEYPWYMFILYGFGILCTVSLPLFVAAHLILLFLQMEKNTRETRELISVYVKNKSQEEPKKENPKPTSTPGKTINEIYGS